MISASSDQRNPARPAVLSTNMADQAADVAADPRGRLLSQVVLLEQQAKRAAEEGDLSEAARAILAALDCERRAGSLGPQVLQLIKPRV